MESSEKQTNKISNFIGKAVSFLLGPENATKDTVLERYTPLAKDLTAYVMFPLLITGIAHIYGKVGLEAANSSVFFPLLLIVFAYRLYRSFSSKGDGPDIKRELVLLVGSALLSRLLAYVAVVLYAAISVSKIRSYFAGENLSDNKSSSKSIEESEDQLENDVEELHKKIEELESEVDSDADTETVKALQEEIRSLEEKMNKRMSNISQKLMEAKPSDNGEAEYAPDSCPKCDRSFVNYRGLISHYGNSHKPISEHFKSGDVFECPFCGEEFDRAHGISSHFRNDYGLSLADYFFKNFEDVISDNEG